MLILDIFIETNVCRLLIFFLLTGEETEYSQGLSECRRAYGCNSFSNFVKSKECSPFACRKDTSRPNPYLWNTWICIGSRHCSIPVTPKVSSRSFQKLALGKLLALSTWNGIIAVLLMPSINKLYKFFSKLLCWS